MTVAKSRLTKQGQISVPAEIRRRLGLAPGAVLEWHVEGRRVTVRRAARFTSVDAHRALFKARPRCRSLEEIEAGIRRAVKNRWLRARR